MNFWTRAELFRPPLCRLLARHRYSRPLTIQEIAERSKGITPVEVIAISETVDWRYVNIRQMQAFLTGCGMDFCDTKAMRRVDDYIRKGPTFQYLRQRPDWTTHYLPLLRHWRSIYGHYPITKASPIWPPIRDLLIRLNPLVQ
jgi:hypothetical protein